MKPRVIILNGFLGSGKTTLFRKLLAQSKKKALPVCAIVNDMSELDVDGELIANTDIVEDNDSIMQSIHSCVLSSKIGLEKLDLALNTLLSNHQPDLIIIETSGSCHPMPLIEFFKTQKHLILTGVFTLVDSLMLAHDYDYGKTLIPKMQQNLSNNKRDMVNLLVEQIMFCSHLILTKSDRIKQEKLSEIAQHIQPINPYVSILAVVFGNLSIDQMLELPEYDFNRVEQLTNELRPVLASESYGDRPYNMATRVIKDHRPFHPQRLWDVCHQYLDKRIYRSKGFFWLASRDKISLLWNQAAGSINLELIGYWRSGILEDENNGLLEHEIKLLEEKIAEEAGRFGDRHCHLTVIGDKTQVDRFTEALKSCFLTEEEIIHYEMGEQFPDPWPKNIVNMAN
ncbi:cobalamin biosynthesis protein CobW [Seonamhaeicola marinus]|uniref:Cobalamin biosynthesis protein CobW n=1 Tax=Seonamhaeicola marinus TaxID=1912246 RepID=A0A5D0IUD6_9FLAO|nr:cobalamin biosynthesis protein CobW [Seonamhaeicola marinus]